MKIINNNNPWFTLIELIVSMTIFMIIIVSVTTVFIFSSDMSRKSDINRSMQENMKNVVEIISEDIRKNWIDWVSRDILDTSCAFNTWLWFYKKWNKLCIWSNVYFLAKLNTSWDYSRVDVSQCSDIKDSCVINKLWYWPITNSLVSVKDLAFFVSDEWTAKVTISIIMQPSIKKWVKVNLIKESKMIFETTISEKPF